MSCYIIAEIGVNHNGDILLAKQLIDVAKCAGADAVKFQTFQADLLVTKSAKKADYQLKTTDKDESQWQMLKKLELSYENHIDLLQYCNEQSIDFLSTPFDFKSLALLTEQLKLERLKISSGDLTNSPMLLACAQSGCQLIISTGMATIEEIKYALSVIAYGYLNLPVEHINTQSLLEAFNSESGKNLLQEKVVILHCTTDYPAQLTDVNLNAIDAIKKAFNMPVGYSDHSVDDLVAQLAVAKGASVVEKHITLDQDLPGPDHKASIEPDAFKRYVEGIRKVEFLLGDGDKKPKPTELKNMAIARKSLIANKPIKAGELFTTENVTIKRPGNGVSPELFWFYLGKTSEQNYQVGELIKA